MKLSLYTFDHSNPMARLMIPSPFRNFGGKKISVPLTGTLAKLLGGLPIGRGGSSTHSGIITTHVDKSREWP